jgi:hypothetical protein
VNRDEILVAAFRCLVLKYCFKRAYLEPSETEPSVTSGAAAITATGPPPQPTQPSWIEDSHSASATGRLVVADEEESCRLSSRVRDLGKGVRNRRGEQTRTRRGLAGLSLAWGHE